MKWLEFRFFCFLFFCEEKSLKRLRWSFFSSSSSCSANRKHPWNSLVRSPVHSHHRFRERVQSAGPVERRDAQGAAALEEDLEKRKETVLEEDKGLRWRSLFFLSVENQANQKNVNRCNSSSSPSLFLTSSSILELRRREFPRRISSAGKEKKLDGKSESKKGAFELSHTDKKKWKKMKNLSGKTQNSSLSLSLFLVYFCTTTAFASPASSIVAESSSSVFGGNPIEDSE